MTTTKKDKARKKEREAKRAEIGSAIIVAIILSALCIFLTGCAAWEAGKEVVETSYKVGKIEGEGMIIDEIEKLQNKILSYQRKLQTCRESKKCMESKKKFLSDAIKKLAKEIKIKTAQ